MNRIILSIISHCDDLNFRYTMLMGFNDIMYHKYALLNNEITKHLGLTFMHYTDDGKF